MFIYVQHLLGVDKSDAHEKQYDISFYLSTSLLSKYRHGPLTDSSRWTTVTKIRLRCYIKWNNQLLKECFWIIILLYMYRLLHPTTLQLIHLVLQLAGRNWVIIWATIAHYLWVKELHQSPTPPPSFFLPVRGVIEAVDATSPVMSRLEAHLRWEGIGP